MNVRTAGGALRWRRQASTTGRGSTECAADLQRRPLQGGDRPGEDGGGEAAGGQRPQQEGVAALEGEAERPAGGGEELVQDPPPDDHARPDAAHHPPRMIRGQAGFRDMSYVDRAIGGNATTTAPS